MRPWIPILMAWLRRWAWRFLCAIRAGRPASPVPELVPAEAPRLQAPLPPQVSVVIPALNEEARIAEVVRHALSDSATAEVIVVDDSSIDRTAALARQAGASVITSTLLGKGASMADGLRASAHEVLVYLDGDLTGLQPGLISHLARPLVEGQADFVKARFGRGGGRVTELTAKPMLKVFFPELAQFAQPLGGIIAARRSLLQQLVFEDGYGVDVGLLIDSSLRGARLTEVDIGRIEHDSQPLHDLTAMANEVSRVIYTRAREAGRLHVDQISAMYEMQRQATASWDYVITRQRGRKRLALLSLEGAIATDSLEAALPSPVGVAAAATAGPAYTSLAARAASLRFVHRMQFEHAAKVLPLRAGVIECVRAMRQAGFMVGVVSNGFFVAADVVRKRVFADFAMANLLHFSNDVCTGQMRVNDAFVVPVEAGDSAAVVPAGSHHVVQRFRTDALPVFETIWAVGGAHDAALLSLADQGFRLADTGGALPLASDRCRCVQDFSAIQLALHGWLAATEAAARQSPPASGQ